MESKEIIKLKNYNDSLKIVENENNIFNNSKNNKNIDSKIIILIYLIIFIILTTIIIILALIIFRNNTSSNILKLKFFSNNYNYNNLYEIAQKCLIKDPDEQLCIYQFLCPKEVKGKKRVLIGEKTDGSYVMLDDFENIKIAYSIGIRDIIQFDKALADKGIDIFMYDHTNDKLPYENKKFHWKKIGLGGNSERKHNIQTLEEMIKENGHVQEKNMILKIDIESAEWNSLNDISENTLLKFKYILVEYHFLSDSNILYYNVLKKIYKTHQVFYAHCCPFLGESHFGNNRICQAIEVSYIIRSGNIFTTDNTIYPVQKFSYGFNPIFDVNILKLFDSYKQ